MANEKRELAEQIALFAWRARFVHVYPKLRWLHSSLNGAYLTNRQRNEMAASGMTAGIPDISLPVGISYQPQDYTEEYREYSGLYIELKVKPNKLTKEQEEFFTHARAEGYRCETCFSWIQAANVIMDYLGIDDARLRDELRMSTPGVKPKVPKIAGAKDTKPKRARAKSLTGSCDAGLMMARQEARDGERKL